MLLSMLMIFQIIVQQTPYNINSVCWSETIVSTCLKTVFVCHLTTPSQLLQSNSSLTFIWVNVACNCHFVYFNSFEDTWKISIGIEVEDS